MHWVWSDSTQIAPSVACSDPCPYAVRTMVWLSRSADAPHRRLRPRLDLGAWWRHPRDQCYSVPTMCAVAPGEARKCAVDTNELFRFNYWSNEPPCLRFTACHLWCQCFLCSKYDRTVPSSKLYTLYEHGVLRKMLCVVYYKRLSDVPHIAGCADHVSNQELTTGTRVTGHWYVRSSHTNCKVRYMYRKCPP